jgi:hypothetical protein
MDQGSISPTPWSLWRAPWRGGWGYCPWEVRGRQHSFLVLPRCSTLPCGRPAAVSTRARRRENTEDKEAPSPILCLWDVMRELTGDNLTWKRTQASRRGLLWLGCNKARRASSFCPLQFLQSWLGRGLPDLVHKLNGSSRRMANISRP